RPSEMTAAAGAKNGSGWPTTSFASAQATPAATADWTIAGQEPETNRSRTPAAPRTRCSRAQLRDDIAGERTPPTAGQPPWVANLIFLLPFLIACGMRPSGASKFAGIDFQPAGAPPSMNSVITL